MRKTPITALVLSVLVLGGTSWNLAAGESEACAECHEEVVQAFAGSSHARLVAGDWFGNSQSCSSCHGPAEQHLEDPASHPMRVYPGDLPGEDSQVCLGCHTTANAMTAWAFGPHADAGLSCLSCHQVHPKPPAPKGTPPLGKRDVWASKANCFECHPEVRAQFRLPSRHPVTEGKMNCASCHNPHGANDALLKTEYRTNDLCLSCHPGQRGPFVFEHAPVEEDCGICHNPHGAVANNLLNQTDPFLCLTCHEVHFHAGLRSPETEVVQFGTIPPNVWQNPFREEGMKHAFLTKCSQCHSRVHGSDQPAQGVTGQGQALTR